MTTTEIFILINTGRQVWTHQLRDAFKVPNDMALPTGLHLGTAPMFNRKTQRQSEGAVGRAYTDGDLGDIEYWLRAYRPELLEEWNAAAVAVKISEQSRKPLRRKRSH